MVSAHTRTWLYTSMNVVHAGMSARMTGTYCTYPNLFIFTVKSILHDRKCHLHILLMFHIFSSQIQVKSKPFHLNNNPKTSHTIVPIAFNVKFFIFLMLVLPRRTSFCNKHYLQLTILYHLHIGVTRLRLTREQIENPLKIHKWPFTILFICLYFSLVFLHNYILQTFSSRASEGSSK